ncbi:YbhB/YbcL family Raf kinase inhibitor-like protein [Sphingomonas sp.]|uniref:YbhB/YbcL family Raf kinase inhibitor-like protein n=1 Tax=Sphingomonas sp. TaxID=28214 RepID=UPI001B12B843|nr:YbhB/YbcL family Raf kinase inhibitor-like protein [Sphingomonas sp.]MBO9712424.1 YbhB/YbcL family Raf kinase inhibitor-like protein [Sphingomonas sp.]
MLEHVPWWLGSALKGVRAGVGKLAIVQPELGTFEALRLVSPAFANGGRIPPRFTADGPGVSPPLFWTGVPEGTERLVLIVEDPDALAPQPVVHAVVWDLPGSDGELAEGAITADGAGDESGDVGRNSLFGEGWLPPDPPPGHGEHHYAFQLFALGPCPEVGRSPGRGAVVKAMAGHVLAAGLLTGTYSRGEGASVGPIGYAAPA